MRWLLVGDATSVHVRRLAAALVAYGLDVHVAGFSPVAESAVTSHELPDRGPGDLRFLGAISALRGIVRAVQPDVVNAHYVTSYGLMATLAGARRVVQTAWGSDLLVTAQRPGHRQLTRWVLRRASLVTGDSQDLLDAAQALAPSTPVHRFVFGPPASAWAPPGRARDPVVVSIRNHEPLYRIGTILEAWPLVQERLPRHRLVVLGSGSLTDELQRSAPPDVEVTGALTHDEVAAVLGRADVVVSVPTSDATSASVLEALAARCAVVASDLPANREWLPAGHLVPEPLTAAALADRIVAASGHEGALDQSVALERQVADLVDRVSALVDG